MHKGKKLEKDVCPANIHTHTHTHTHIHIYNTYIYTQTIAHKTSPLNNKHV